MSSSSSSSLEAKIVVLGAQGVGKTSLVTRYCKGDAPPSSSPSSTAFPPRSVPASTVGAGFLTKRVVDVDTDTVVRLQIWDTAGQERFRSISRLYYRGANAAILCYDLTSAPSFALMATWLAELRLNLPADAVLHVVGTKADLVARDPAARQVPFERCIAYVAENLAPGVGATPPPTANGTAAAGPRDTVTDTDRGNGGSFWAQQAGWDACHEISALTGDGVDEVFRVVTRKLVQQSLRQREAAAAAAAAAMLLANTAPYSPYSPAGGGGAGISPWDQYYHRSDLATASDRGDGNKGYFDGTHYSGASNNGSFRVGRDRRSWLFASPPSVFSPGVPVDRDGAAGAASADGRAGSSRCC